MISGQNGILTKAGEAKIQTDFEKTKEELGLAITSASLDYYNGGKTGTLRDYLFSSEGQAKIKSELGTNDITFNSSNHTITYKGIVFTIAEDGTIKSGIEVAEVNPDNLEAEELPDDFWIASEGVAYINTKYIDSPGDSYYEYGYDYGYGYGSYGGIYQVQAGACQYTRITVPSNIGGETVTAFSVANVNNIELLDLEEGIKDIPELSTVRDTMKKLIIPKELNITEIELKQKLTNEFGTENIGYITTNSNDNKFYIIEIKDQLQLALSITETESRAVYIDVLPTLGGSERKKNVILTCSNGETIFSRTNNQEDFVITKNGDYTVIATLEDGKTASQTISVTNCKIEEYSSIQDSNYTIKQGDYTAIIPAGFAYGTSSNVGAIASGLVITDSIEVVNGKNYSNGNEFVWIPIDKTTLNVVGTSNKIATATSGTDSKGNLNYQGALYNGWNTGMTYQINDVQTNESGYREPAYLRDSTWSDDSSYNDDGTGRKVVTETSLQESYNAMIESVKTYGGFYTGRYQMGKGENYSKLGKEPASASDPETKTWYGLYKKAKSYANPEDSNKNIVSYMIWSSQHDAMLNFGFTGNDRNKISAWINGNYNYSQIKTGVYKGGIGSVNNIFDLKNGFSDWTQGAFGSRTRIMGTRIYPDSSVRRRKSTRFC